MKHLRYPKHCQTCRVDACTDCGHHAKRQQALIDYYNEIENEDFFVAMKERSIEEA